MDEYVHFYYIYNTLYLGYIPFVPDIILSFYVPSTRVNVCKRNLPAISLCVSVVSVIFPYRTSPSNIAATVFEYLLSPSDGDFLRSFYSTLYSSNFAFVRNNIAWYRLDVTYLMVYVSNRIG